MGEVNVLLSHVGVEEGFKYIFGNVGNVNDVCHGLVIPRYQKVVKNYLANFLNSEGVSHSIDKCSVIGAHKSSFLGRDKAWEVL